MSAANCHSQAEMHFKFLERFAPPSVIVDADDNIIHLSEGAAQYLQVDVGASTLNLLRVVDPMSRMDLGAALSRARQTANQVVARDVRTRIKGTPCLVDLWVIPAQDLAADLLLVIFDAKRQVVSSRTIPSRILEPIVQHMEQEINQLKAQQRESAEQHEELQEINEELRTATEELERSREELYSMYEELSTVNQELKSRVEEVRRGNNDLQNLIASTNIATIFLDKELLIKLYTPAALALFSLISTDIGRRLSDLRSRLEYDSIVSDARRVLDQETIVEQEMRSVDNHWYLARFLPYRTGEDQVAGVVLTFVDITERRRLEMQLVNAQKMEAIGQLAGGVAHDFNNLLSVISGHSELLARLSTSDEPWQESIKEIRRATELAAALTERLLAFGRRQILKPKVLDLNAVVADAEKLMRRLIGEDVHLTTSLQAGLSPVCADLAQLNQVILNLAVNGRDAMPRGGSLILETREIEVDTADFKAYPDVGPGRYVLLSITDTGCGMAPEVQARIFEPFFTTKPEGKGTGLGLSVALGIIRQSGGYLDVESKPGKGSKFKIYLPAAQEPAEAPRLAQRTHVDPVGGGETVLLVEDEDMVRNVTSLLLESLGYRVLKAANGQQALRLFETTPEKIALLMTDMVMPDVTGQEVAETLLGRDPGLAVIFQSGYTDDVMVRQGILDTQVAFLKKPFSREVLSRKVREVLDRPHCH